MNIKRLLSALLAILVMPVLLPVHGLAAAHTDSAVIIAAGSAAACPGSSAVASVPVYIEAGSAYEAHSLDIVIEYDPDMLQIKSVPSGAFWNELPDDAIKSCDFRSSPGRVFITVLCPNEGFTGGGVLKNIYFVMTENCTEDQPVTVTVNEFVNFPASGSAVDIPYTVQNGSVDLMGYNEHDFNKLLAFLCNEDEYGFINGIKVDASFEPHDPHTWGNIEWTPYMGELHLFGIGYASRGLCGELDLEGCEALASLDINNNHITGLNISGCSALESIDCFGCRLSEIDLTSCPLLSQNVIRAQGGGTVGYFELMGERAAQAVPDDGFTFEGWYYNGALISTQAAIDCSAYPGVITAVFTGGAGPLIGDVNLDGDVTFADVSELYSIMTGVGNPSAESMAAADVNMDGDVTFADVSALYDFLIHG